MGNAIAYRCVRMIAEAAASVPWLLYEGRGRAGNPSAAGICCSAPNRDESGAELFTAWYGHLQTAGNAYLEAATLRGEVRELHVLRPDRMKVVASARARRPMLTITPWTARTVRLARDAATGFMPVLQAQAVSSAGRSLRPVADRGGGHRHRRPQCGRGLDQGAARQCGAAFRRAHI